MLLIFGILCSACQQKQEYQLTGTFNGPVDEEWIYLGKFMGEGLKPDSARIENGRFVFKGTVDFPEVYGLSYHPSTSPEIAPLFLEPGSINITIDLQDWYSGSIISGGIINSQYQEFTRVQNEKFLDEIMSLSSQKRSAEKEEAQVIEMRITELFDLNDEYTMEFIKDNPNSPVSVFLLGFIYPGLETDELGKILNSFSPQVESTSIYLSIKEYYDTQLALEHKTPALSLSENTEEIDIVFGIDNIIPTLISRNKGKPIYLNIWGSWCNPCKEEFPHIRDLQTRIDNNDLVFAYFCVLSKEEDWRMLIQKEELKGQHFLLSNELSEALLAAYNNKTVPKYILIDRDGEIIDMNAPKPSDERILALLNDLVK